MSRVFRLKRAAMIFVENPESADLWQKIIDYDYQPSIYNLKRKPKQEI